MSKVFLIEWITYSKLVNRYVLFRFCQLNIRLLLMKVSVVNLLLSEFCQWVDLYI